jgi:hypothetical protein
VFLRLASLLEEGLLVFLVVVVRVLFVNFHGGEGQLPTEDQGGLKFVISEVVEGQTPLLQSLLHQSFQGNQIS